MADDPTKTAPKPADDPTKTAPKPADDPTKTAPKPADDPTKTAPKPADDPTKTAPKPADDPTKTAPKPADDTTKTAPKPLGGETSHQHPDEPRDPRFFWLTVFQYVLIAGVVGTFVAAILIGTLKEKANLGDNDEARGLITFVIAVGTIAIAIILVLASIIIRDFKERITAGKEILTILVAVLGTIVGFYYGAAKKETPQTPTASASQISASAPKITPSELARDDTVTLSVALTGGTPPYTYTLKVSPDKIPPVPVTEKVAATGEITELISGKGFPADAKAVAFVIEGKDKTGAPFAINKDGKITIPLK